MAFAPPPGTTLRSRCLRIKTGASRETREISPNTNSSATRSPTTVMVTLGKDSTIFLSRSDCLGCWVIRILSQSFLSAESGATLIFSCRTAALFNGAQHGIQGVIRIEEFHFDGNNCQRNKGRKKFAQVDGVFFCGDKATGFALRAMFDQVRYIALGIGVMIAIECFGCRFDACGAELHQEIPWTRNTTKGNRPGGDILRKNAASSSPHYFPI